MKKLICLTRDLFTDKSYSINYHLMLLIKCVLAGNGYEIVVYSYENKPQLSQNTVLSNLGFQELSEKATFCYLTTMAPGAWVSCLLDGDILLCQHYSFSDILREIKERKPNMKIVSWIHSIVQEEYLSGAINGKNDAYIYIKQQNEQVRLSDLCIFDSQYDYQLGRIDFLQLSQTAVIYPVTDMERYAEEWQGGQNDIFRDKNIQLRDLELLFVGRWDYRKGLDSLIPCSFRLFMEHGLKTILLTDGWQEYVLSDQAGRRQFRSLVRSGGLQFESWKPNKREYARFLCEKRRVAIMPSYYDPFNMAAYDCAVLGLPLLISNRCGACEILDASESLAICNPYDIETFYRQIYNMCESATGLPSKHTLRYGLAEFEQAIHDVFYSREQ